MRFIETMFLENGIVKNLDLHSERSSATILHHFGIRKTLPFTQLLKSQKLCTLGVYKFRVVYSQDIEDFTVELYSPRKINSLNLVNGESVDYSFKYEDRSQIENLLRSKFSCDDILIIKNGFVTDTSFANIVFSKDGELFTPTTFLLNGTKRKHLIQIGKIKEIEIPVDDISRFDKYFLINSMLDFYPVDRIFRYNF